jgi:hypothetical protein
MTLAIMQPYIFPYIGYFQLINRVDKFVIYDDVNYINKGWINRNQLLVGGKAGMFTIPLKEASQNKKIYEIGVSDFDKWSSKFKKGLKQSYAKAPFVREVCEIVDAALDLQPNNVAELCVHALANVNIYLGITTQIEPSSRIYENSDLKGQERILDICLKENADHYINPIGGQELYDKEIFDPKGITLNFIKSQKIEYPQFNQPFVEYLSILDVMMFNSPEKISTFLQKFELI